MNNDFNFNPNFEHYNFSNSYWDKYNKILKDLSIEQKIFVSKQKNVLQAKQNLMSSFIDYLFEQNKNIFVMANDSAKTLADEYINAITKASEDYVSHQEQLEKENAKLEKEKNELEKQLQKLLSENKKNKDFENDKPTTK